MQASAAATNTSSLTGSNTNLTAATNTATSTPIRIGSGKNQAHNLSGGSGVGIAAGDSSTVATATGANAAMTALPLAHQSSSVPTSSSMLLAAGSGGGSHLQSPAQPSLSLGMGASNQSLGVASLGAASSVSGISITPPNSAGLRQAGGLANWANDSREVNLVDKSPADSSKLNRKESYKAQRKNYRREKKRVASELMNSLQDPAVIVLADWLKVRGTLKSWTKLWCVLKPGLLLIYKSPKTKSSHWVGTVMLTSCQLIERPSKKDGFCFKLFHPLEQSIWAPRGPDKETIGAVVQPLPTAYLIFRAPSQAAGKCWMDALELSLRCSALLLRSSNNSGSIGPSSTYVTDAGQISHETQWSEADYEKHFNDHDLDADSQNEAPNVALSGPDSESESDAGEVVEEAEEETPYVAIPEEEFSVMQSGEQVEELGEENKSLIWCLVKQVRPGMDLSKVVLPTFILEPRSFLDKLCDSYYHADILSKAVLEDDPFTRMKYIVQWYLSGFYKKPKGLKKPYNPILGECFRCYWQHANGSRTYYIAEQVSHHPPISAFYVTNRQDGFCISCSILAKSKFYGNSTSAVLEGVASLTLLPRGESYALNTPYAHCKGILMGTLSMELGGKVSIDCENTGYKTELEFKLKPFLGGADSTNIVVGKIKLGKQTMATINGRWDGEMFIRDAKSNEDTILFAANEELKRKRLVRYVVPLDVQEPNESQRLWLKVSEAIAAENQVVATEEKTVLEDIQRQDAKARAATGTQWQTQHFDLDANGQWQYKHADLRAWDTRNDVRQYEREFVIKTETKVKAPPIVRTASIVSHDTPLLRSEKSSKANIKATKSISNKTIRDTDSSQSMEELTIKRDVSIASKELNSKAVKHLLLAIEHVNAALDKQSRQLNEISNKLERIQYAPPPYATRLMGGSAGYGGASAGSGWSQQTIVKTIFYAFIGLVFSLVIRLILK